MKLVAVAIFDSAAAAFQRPWFVPHAPMAVRAFQDEATRQESEIAKHPADYVLFELGTFDEESGKMENLASPRQLVRAIDLAEVRNGKSR